MTIHQHIEELRAELSASTDIHEIRLIRTELEQAISAAKRLDAEFEAILRRS